MSQGILQTALNNKTLGLELEYRELSTIREGESAFTSEWPRLHPSTSPEFAELLSAV